jgi:formamidopyrimidine-DNA glycosylase
LLYFCIARKLITSPITKPIINKAVPIKTALLDQTIIAGLGNIYVDEVCFLSRLHPLRICSSLSLDDCNNIVDASKKTLRKAISEGGTTIRSYTSSEGVHGRFQQNLKVHNNKGKKCENCNTLIDKITVNGRGTFYCPKCQK